VGKSQGYGGATFRRGQGLPSSDFGGSIDGLTHRRDSRYTVTPVLPWRVIGDFTVSNGQCADQL